jgi:hypothetical protein
MQYSKAVRDEIKQFLQEGLHLRLNMEKTKITHAHNDKAFLLGYFIQRGNKASIIYNTSFYPLVNIFLIQKAIVLNAAHQLLLHLSQLHNNDNRR